eukprot:3545412-Amphidinium_carterae.1
MELPHCTPDQEVSQCIWVKKETITTTWKTSSQVIYAFNHVLFPDSTIQPHRSTNDPKKHINKYQRKVNEKTAARNKTQKFWETKHFNNFNNVCFL